MLPAALTLALSAAPVPPEAAARARVEVAASAARPLVVRALGVDDAALRDALRRRSGGASVVLLREAAAVDPDHVFIDVVVDAEVALTIILPDGRVYARRAPAPAGPRDVARLVAAVLAAIADQALAPLPERAVSPALDPGAGPRGAAEVPTSVPVEPEDMSQETVAPDARAAKARAYDFDDAVIESVFPRPPPGRDPARPAASARPRRPRPDLTIALSGAPVVALYPGRGVVAGAGALALELRGARPWLASAALRAGGAEAGNFTLLRVRASLAAGTWYARGRFDLRASAGISLEPWSLIHEGRRVRLDAPLAPLLGAHLRVAPSVAISGPLLVGLFLEFAASAVPRGDAVRVSLADQRLFVLGGAELSLGIELRMRARDRVASRPQGAE